MQSDQVDQEMFLADRPIHRIADDKLDRDRFARRLGDAVVGWHGRDSLVIGLYGRWGSGKSSLKNMVIESIEAQTPKPLIVDFSVWQFANRDQLTESFFDQLGLVLGKGTVGSQKDRRRLVRLWRTYSSYLTSAGSLVPLVKTGISSVLMLAGFLMLSSAFDNLRQLSAIVGAILLLVGGILRWFGSATEQVANLLAVRSESGRKTLEEVKQEVSREVSQLKHPVVVILDDIDRLTPAETVEMMQLVKANADFPNVIYVLLCQRESVERHLGESLHVDGRDYLDKIVQVAFDIPFASRQKIHEVLFAGLNRLLLSPEVEKHFDKYRWANVFHNGLEAYFETLRHVNRYLASLSFSVSVFKNGGVFEVNLIDLIIIETLRVFEPELYHQIARRQDLLTNALYSYGNEKAKGKEVQDLLSIVPEARRERAKALVQHLFPQVSGFLGGVSYAASDEQWYRERRVCSKDVFERYFAFELPRGDVSPAVLEKLVEATADRDTFVAELERLQQRGLLPVVVDRLEAYKEEVPQANSYGLVTGLFDIGDALSSESPGMFETTPQMHGVRIVFWNLQKMNTDVERADVLKRALMDTTGISLPVDLIAIESQAAEKAKTDPNIKRSVNDEQLKELQGLCVKKIEQAAATGQLAEAEDLLSILYRWQEWAGVEVPREYCRGLLETSEGALALARAFVSRTLSHGGGDTVAREKFHVNLSVVETFIPYAEVEQALKPLDVTSMSEEDRRAVELFHKAAARRLEGKPDLGNGRLIGED